ncbi:DUF2637 domain-containing protein [Streptomyces sp. NBC_01500]|uniref:DUF2637 domain-containing protein n=1 Tax=Streptomyces sp. NBC_01500 TaxID=2903886 RepID=UPI00224D3CD7|nr:DUF2637 domain-containing protein [Streptomyces sp. NBC_01500]MCX4549354.1 DUF2637 domain-containing protein [Streptomyces sp. NBC_01500]
MTTPATPHDTPRHTHATPRAQDTKRQATPQHAAERYALAAAGTVIIALTAGGFWLSYAHLAQVAGQHGLGSSPVRQWAWPATLDAFIVAGELLMLRAGLRRVTDWWAVGLTAIGSAGSIALNVAGVSGTGNERVAPLLDYVVAAVPPTAALLAFGVLMRQIHQLVARASDRPATGSVETPDSPAVPPAHIGQSQATASGPRNALPRISKSLPRGGRPVSATVEELVEIGRIAAAEKRKLTRGIVQQAIRDKGHTVGGQRLTEVMEILRSEPGADRNVS